ncbi:hypothetical protein BCON_0380g00020 [Botryotinia convoluta]|uniref:Uncharacterized protein n=1 Tax=Botryotinia convoluta TaxID=54673 RepID=A0A4Z1H8X2_9HELO|nr:hypothetical protein BCON_0380g00020 [Botryotinia convoluta]
MSRLGFSLDSSSPHESGLDEDAGSLNYCCYGGDVEDKNSEKIDRDFVRGPDGIRTHIRSKLGYIEGTAEASRHDDVPDVPNPGILIDDVRENLRLGSRKFGATLTNLILSEDGTSCETNVPKFSARNIATLDIILPSTRAEEEIVVNSNDACIQKLTGTKPSYWDCSFFCWVSRDIVFDYGVN